MLKLPGYSVSRNCWGLKSLHTVTSGSWNRFAEPLLPAVVGKPAFAVAVGRLSLAVVDRLAFVAAVPVVAGTPATVVVWAVVVASPAVAVDFAGHLAK